MLELALAPKDIVQLKCAPEEGFVLSRINGIYTVAQILALVPGERLYNQLIIHNLLQRGVIELRGRSRWSSARNPPPAAELGRRRDAAEAALTAGAAAVDW